MHVECWGTGVDFLAVTPYKVQSGVSGATHGTLICPMPSKLVEGTMQQLGKQYVWQGHGYWFHGLLGHLANYYPSVTSRYRKMMKDTRKRYDELQQQQHHHHQHQQQQQQQQISGNDHCEVEHMSAASPPFGVTIDSNNNESSSRSCHAVIDTASKSIKVA